MLHQQKIICKPRCTVKLNVVQCTCLTPQRTTAKGKKMEDERQGMLHQLMLERMQALDEALQRAESGAATADDWATIRYECGMPTVKTQTLRSE
jgi:hypothetical protein